MAKLEKSSTARRPAGDADFARNLRFLRKHYKLSQEQLAEKVGMTKGLISQYEKADTAPAFDTLKKLGEALDCGVDALLFGPNNRYRQSTLAGMSLDDRVGSLPSALREYVLLAVKKAEAAKNLTPATFLKEPTGESWEEFNDLLTDLALGKREAPR